jgi:hypothetical protein
MPGRFFQPVAGRSGLFRRRRRPSIGSPGERCEREFPVEDVVAGSGAGHRQSGAEAAAVFGLDVFRAQPGSESSAWGGGGPP